MLNDDQSKSSEILLTEMTLPRAERDLLMLAPSFNLSPVAPVLSALSEPEQNLIGNLKLSRHLKVFFSGAKSSQK